LRVDVSRLGMPEGAVLIDQLSAGREVRVAGGRINVNLPERSTAMFVRR